MSFLHMHRHLHLKRGCAPPVIVAEFVEANGPVESGGHYLPACYMGAQGFVVGGAWLPQREAKGGGTTKLEHVLHGLRDDAGYDRSVGIDLLHAVAIRCGQHSIVRPELPVGADLRTISASISADLALVTDTGFTRQEGVCVRVGSKYVVSK